jgi:tRNA (mo5U34)-methyltransferase
MTESKSAYLDNRLPVTMLSGLDSNAVSAYDCFRNEKSRIFARESFSKLNNLVTAIGNDPSFHFKIMDDCICFINDSVADPLFTTELEAVLRALMPWRKGPWQYGPIHIDAEWKSGLKWNRMLAGLPDLAGKRVCDAGCNNLYYTYRMLDYKPEFVFAFDPYERYFHHFRLNQKLCPFGNLYFDFFGVEHFDLFKQCFDVIFCMGILYHRRDPVGMLKMAGESLVPGGILVLESLCLPDSRSICLFPEDRYLKAPGYWFIPSPSALVAMMKRTGFRNIEILSESPLTGVEQRRTEWAVFESLDDYLDPEDKSKTVEGYPAPNRITLRGEKK